MVYPWAGGKRHHPRFQDMKGQTLGALEIEERATNSPRGNARWLVRCLVCGKRDTREGISIRATKGRCRGCGKKV